MTSFTQNQVKHDIFYPLRHWLYSIRISNSQQAHLLCKLIPAQCPFEREITLLGHQLFHIPPICKLNPVYEELVSLRFLALCYLVSEGNKDVTS